jgi:L-ascorbate metabolism protein UlaG (beta-lactamase superfamily)
LGLGRETAITWLGHATFDIETPGGKRLLIDPWLTGNPACPEDRKTVDRVDVMAITHGHGDHIGDAVDVAKAHSPQVVGIVEVCTWLEGKGVQNTNGINKGGSVELEGIRFTLVHALHSSGIPDGDQTVYGGEAAGFVITFENGFRVYVAGDTMPFSDMRIIGELWRPELAILPIGDYYTMDPRQAAYALRLLGCNQVLPCHYGTFPALSGTPDELRREAAGIEGLQVHALQPGETLR